MLHRRILTAEEAIDLDCLCLNEQPSSPVAASSITAAGVSTWTELARVFAGVSAVAGAGREDLAGLVTASHYPHSIIVDCTASDEVAADHLL